MPEACTASAFSPGGECLATGDETGRVRVRPLPDLQEILASFHEDRATIDSLALQRDPRPSTDVPTQSRWLLAAGDAGGTIRIFRLATRSVQAICHGPEYDVCGVAFSPDGLVFATRDSRDLTITLLRPDNPAWRLTVDLDHDPSNCLRFCPDGRRLAVGTRSGPVLVDDIPETIRH